ncbi:Outward-rectifier potassium channel TOK1 [Cyphellophora attinorum]|uniref:Outward-rectifier potassium channel TOK1 n=1 Tax=Cyphellophora attinorum TaxID=1664694 RepID=A0A0N0NR47_9EURO|nr:Outward-rectifier potassium channel TOK1 [Phialophora attinorum]KPI44668.1 Outward-rectifier potassium channel TOK1 [Phialophora attinorum]
MNDPGLDGPIGNADERVKEEYHDEREDEDDTDPDEDEEQNYLIPTRWWYASTACPLAAGTFGPMANAFSICALVENWRVYVPPGGSADHGIDVKDPRWLIAINAVSLACALIANLSLLLNMARRVPFAIAQPITIIGFWVASVLLIALISVANTSIFDLPNGENKGLSGAYYYAIFAAGLYQIISYLMCATVYGAYTGHYSKEFKLTVAQRTLMLQTISFLVWQHLWALGYSHIEGWHYLDAVYWADFTSLTIGVGGTFVPKTHTGRSLLFFFALGGVVILGLLVGSIRSLVLDRGKEKIEARMTEKARQRLVHRVARAIERQDKAPKRPLNFLHIHKLNDTIRKALVLQPGTEKMTEKTRRHYEFEAMRRIQYVASARRRYFSLCISVFAFAFLWFIGALVFYKAEYTQNWSYFACIYFSYTTLLTIGYGDYEPMSHAGKAFFVFWTLLAIPTLTILISNMGDTVVKWVKDVTIWVGEVTVLPSSESTILDRLKYGALKAIFGKRVARERHTQRISARQGRDEDTEAGENVAQPPGRILGLKQLRKRHKQDKQKSRDTMDPNERLAADYAEEEGNEEEDAKQHGNKVAEDEHHLRRQLLEEIRKVYADSNAAEPKQYTYDEWVYYIALLGQDEGDSKYHRQPNAADDAPGSHSGKGHASGPDSPTSPKSQRHMASLDDDGPLPDPESFQWSWVGQRSPLMNEKSEPEWLLDRLFRKLEASLQKQLPANDGSTPPQRNGDTNRERPESAQSSSTEAALEVSPSDWSEKVNDEKKELG